MTRLERVLLSISAATLVVFAFVRIAQARPPVRDWIEPVDSLVEEHSMTFALALTTGDTIQLPRQGRRTLVIAYRTDCQFCEASRPSWKRAFASACDVDVVLVSSEPLDLLRDHWDEHGLTGCTNIAFGRAVDPPAFQATYGVGGTPRHYLIGTAGVLEGVWRGVVRGRGSERNFLAGLVP